ncbi:Hypothetical protein LUCI_5187 [Lucifera butyrica]|uniref:Uncharacterized protein n=1 Tax=Lucifera butyrica TaxID=1351585 RepID=A0A498REZ1_9FIRM|nr:glycosyltransferase family 9 protein [Lucifera butyrica]VBB09889.1 Hypothetical protein LUCI_5187 [Lucifera butyrica]
MKRILIIRLSSIGDVIHATPVASSLKAAWPDCHITWLVGEVCAPLLQHNPAIDEMIVWPREHFDAALRRGNLPRAWRVWQGLKRKLASRQFDIVLDIHGLLLTGLITRTVKARRKIGLSTAGEGNPYFMTETAAPRGGHIIDKYLGVLAALGISGVKRPMTLIVPEAARRFAGQFLRQEGVLRQDKVVILIPGTTWPSKNWPVPYFAAVARALAGDLRVVLCGGKQEFALSRMIAAQAGVALINATGRTGLLEMAALLERAAVVVSGDTGPLHMAAALGIPTVAVFGPTDPAVYGPEGNKHVRLSARLPCSLCHKRRCPKNTMHCMSSVQPITVIQAVYRLLEVTPAGMANNPAGRRYGMKRIGM